MNRIFSSRFWSRVAVLFLVVATVSLTGCASIKISETPTPTQIPLQTQTPTQPQTPILTVTGKGTVKIPATLVQVSLGMDIQGQTAQEAQQEVVKRSEALVTLLRSSNVEQLQTTRINLNPIYIKVNNNTQITGYTASSFASFRLVSDRVGNLLDRAVATGANRIDSLGLVATDEAIDTARQQALQSATQDAQKQADAVLTSLNLTRRQIVSIQVNPSTSPSQPINFAESSMQAFAKDTANTVLVGGEQQVQAFVTLHVSY
ncbi:MAG: SIMPL domain-containing protein [Geitlerinemataceae cyanobacterium]